ncbi:MAG: hypothetical protein HY481_02505 [Candidatus Vogelbacteria bacterium]|nr:hypothetical protein [Candidatus Vogelbacteria bacterium]
MKKKRVKPVRISQPKPVSEMTLGERGREIVRLRREITHWAEQYGNARCHEVDERLANVIGLSLYPSRQRRPVKISEFNRCCKDYQQRELRAGRLLPD